MRKRLLLQSKRSAWGIATAFAVFGLLGAAGLISSGRAQAQPGGGAGVSTGATVTIGDATAAPGGEAAVTVSLATDVPAAAVQVDILYNGDDAAIANPATACALDGRLDGGQTLSASFPSVQPEPPTVLLRLGIFPPLVFPNPTFDSGDLVTCTFTVSEEAEVDSMIPLEADRTQVAVDDTIICDPGACGEEDGVITVADADPTPTGTEMEDTPTPGTPTPDTPTPTDTPDAPTCTRDADCPTGTTCQDNVCLPVDCTDDTDCPPGSECVTNGGVTSGGEGPIGQCVPIDCETNTDCPERSVCDENGECRPQYCDDNNDCDGDDVCAEDGICSPTCENDGQCSPEVCVDGDCVECRDDSQCPGGICVDNSCMTVETSFSLAVSPASQMGVAGGTVSVEVILSSVPAGAEADSVSNTLEAASGLALVACTVAAEVAEGAIEIVDGSTLSATLSGAPSGSVYACSVAIAAGPAGPRGIDCSDGLVNGAAVSCSGATIIVTAEEPATPTPTESPTTPPTVTATPVPPTTTPTNTPRLDFDDDGCSVAPASANANPIRGLLFVLVPVALLWRRRRY